MIRDRSWLIVLLLLPLAAAACQPTAEAPSPAPDPRIAEVEQSLLPGAIVAGEPGWSLEERRERYGVPGVSVAVIHDFEVAWAKGYGLADRETGEPVTAETLFQAASISKPVTAAAVLRLVDQGLVDLDAPINDVLRSWQLPDNPLTAEAPVTLRRLLSHTAGTTVHGFPGYAVDEEVPSVVQVLDGAAPANTAAVRVDLVPGSRERYSGGGFTVAQLALTDLRGQPFPALMRELVLEPAGMAHSTYEQPLPPERLASAAAGYRSSGKEVYGKRHTYPEMAAAGLWTTPADLGRFAIAIQRSLAGDEGALLSPATARAMVTPVLGRAGLGFFVPELGDGAYFAHSGGNEGFRCLLVAHRDGGYGAAVMTSSDDGFDLAGEIVRAVARVYGWDGYLDEPIEPVTVTSEALDGYVGRYEILPDRILVVERRGDRLYGGLVHEDDRSWLIPLGDDAFVSQARGQRGRFVRHDEGRVTGYRGEGEGAPLHRRLADDETAPVELLVDGRTDDAVAAYRDLRPEESRLNRLGYGLLQHGRAEQAVAILRLNTELYPDSANAYDSLAEAYRENGDAEGAAAAWRRVLELTPREDDDPGTVERLRARAEKELARLARERRES